MYRGVCFYVKARIFFVKNKSMRSTRTDIHVYVCGYGRLVCLSHLIYWLFKPTVGMLMYLRAPDFFFLVRRIRFVSVCLYVTSPVLTKKFQVLLLFEWIKIRYFKFTRVGFILSLLKFKCTDE